MAKQSFDVEIMDTKAYKALVKEIGDTNAQEWASRPSEELKAVITTATLQKQDAKDQTLANEAYQKAKDVVADFNGALRDTNKPLDLRIKLASRIIKNRKAAGSDV